MIDEDQINLLIDQKRAFKIGARGIAVSFFFSENTNTWVIDIGRAFCEIHADLIGACSDTDFYVLEMQRLGELVGELNLLEYDKLTVIG